MLRLKKIYLTLFIVFLFSAETVAQALDTIPKTQINIGLNSPLSFFKEIEPWKYHDYLFLIGVKRKINKTLSQRASLIFIITGIKVFLKGIPVL